LYFWTANHLMQFNSFAFAVFLPIVFLIYWFVFNKNVRSQNLFILLASYFFYGWWDWRFLGILMFTTIVDYFLAIRIHKAASEKTGKIWLGLSLFMNLGLLCFFKYWNFFVDSWITAWSSLGVHMNPLTVSVILPIGISFYTFQELSYTLDVYKKRMEPVLDLVGFAAFITFFPQLVAGPIERASTFIPQFLKSRQFSTTQAITGCRLILWGLLKKVVIADNLAVYVNNIYENYESLPGLVLLLGAVLFAFQIFADFSGYSDIALGTAKLFGFDLIKNFNNPFSSKSITEFWRRWHISLSSWFNDYLFTPLYTSLRNWDKAGLAASLFITFFLSGLWHGAGWTFIIYGSMHGLALVYEVLTKKQRKKASSKINQHLYNNLSMLLTFSFVVVSWIFFRSVSTQQAFGYLHKIFTGFTDGTIDTRYLNASWLVCLSIAIEYLCRKNEYAVFIPSKRMPSYLLFALEVIAGLLVIDSSITLNHDQFIYFQF
jgi:alginate O-acetyltransferase complex protein AlgI